MITTILRDWCRNSLYTYLVPLKYYYENERFDKIQYCIKLLQSFRDSDVDRSANARIGT